MMEPRIYRQMCLCEHTMFYPDHILSMGDRRGIWRGIWCTPYRHLDVIDEDVSQCVHCLCEVGVSRSGKPWMRKPGPDASRWTVVNLDVPDPRTWAELEWFEDEEES